MLRAYRNKRYASVAGMYAQPVRKYSNGGVTIKHREYIRDISSSTSFSNLSFAFNPGLEDTFPWLCNVASNFEEYSINYAQVQFISTSADALNSVNTALGTIIMVADYNAANPPFNSKLQMENSMLGISGKPSCDIRMPIDVRQKHSPLSALYVRTTAVPTGTDQRLYDFCTFQVGTVGSQAEAVIGELWIDYSITFYKPILSNVLSAPRVLYAHYRQTIYSSAAPINGGLTGSPSTLIKVDDNIGLSFGLNTISFPLGSIQVPVQVVIIWNSADTAMVVPTVAGTNATAYKIISTAGGGVNATNFNIDQEYAATTNTCTYVGYWDMTDNSVSVLTFTGGTLASTGSRTCDIIISGLSVGDD